MVKTHDWRRGHSRQVSIALNNHDQKQAMANAVTFFKNRNVFNEDAKHELIILIGLTAANFCAGIFDKYVPESIVRFRKKVGKFAKFFCCKSTEPGTVDLNPEILKVINDNYNSTDKENQMKGVAGILNLYASKENYKPEDKQKIKEQTIDITDDYCKLCPALIKELPELIQFEE